MTMSITRRAFLAATASAVIAASSTGLGMAADKVILRLSSPSTPTDQRAIALTEIFGPAVSEFATFEPHWNSTLFKQGTELEAIARGNLEMSIASAQELAAIFPEWSVFSAGYLHRDAAHQKEVFAADLMHDMKKKVEDDLGVKLLTVMYLGRRHLNLRTEKEVKTPADLAGIKLRMPGSDAWQFLGNALGANPVPMAFTELYTALQTGAIDGQDNPLPTVMDSKFYEVTKQIVLTSHLVDLNYLTLSKRCGIRCRPRTRPRFRRRRTTPLNSAGRTSSRRKRSWCSSSRIKASRSTSRTSRRSARTCRRPIWNSDFSKDWPEGIVEKINAIQ